MSRKSFFTGSFFLSSTTVLSYILGLLRDRLLAHTFGATRAFDTYSAAFNIPDLIQNIFVAGALTAAFIPLFSELTEKGNKEDSSEFTSSVINSTMLVVFVVSLAAFIAAPWLAPHLVKGFSPADQHTYVNLLRLLLLSPIIFAVSNTLGSVLVTQERFFWYGMSASFFNIGTILGTLLLSAKYGIYGVATGTLGGALLHLIPRIFATAKEYRYRARITLSSSLKSFGKLMIPRMIGAPIEQLIFLGFNSAASVLAAGSITVLTIAHNFQSMPINVIGITFAIAIFPVLSKAAARSDMRSFKKEFWFTIGISILATSAAAAVTYLIREPLIKYLIGGGAYNHHDIALTASTLAFFVWSIPTESLSHVFSRTFYALKNSLIPTVMAGVGLGLALVTAPTLVRSYGVQGLAIAYFIGSAAKCLLMFVFLIPRLRPSLSS